MKEFTALLRFLFLIGVATGSMCSLDAEFAILKPDQEYARQLTYFGDQTFKFEFMFDKSRNNMTSSDWMFSAILDLTPLEKRKFSNQQTTLGSFNRIEIQMQPIGFEYRPGLPQMPTRHLNVSLLISIASLAEAQQG